jgi:hypothetical protein
LAACIFELDASAAVRRTTSRSSSSDVAGSDGEAGRHPLHIPLERPREGLVEVVEIEQQPAFG